MEFTTGDQIRKRRIKLKLTQKDIGDQLGVTGPAVSKWERGHKVKGQVLKDLAKLLMCEVEDLFEAHNRRAEDIAGNNKNEETGNSEEIIFMVREIMNSKYDEGKKLVYGEIMFQYQKLIQLNQKAVQGLNESQDNFATG